MRQVNLGSARSGFYNILLYSTSFKFVCIEIEGTLMTGHLTGGVDVQSGN